MKTINLTQGHVALVDDEDYEYLSQFKWRYVKKSGAVTGESKSKGNLFIMHRLIMDSPSDKQVDHINRDILDNRKENLRVCTSSQNCMNRNHTRIKKYSKYKGVTWDKGRNKYIVHIKKDGKLYNVGRFTDEKEAALAYNKRALELHGEYALLNVLED